MKKLILSAVMIVSSVMVNAQFAKLSPDGFILGENNKGLIIEVPGKTASELYKNTLDFINKNYNNPENKISADSENKYLRFTTIDNNIAKINTINIGGGKNIAGTTTYELDFKDGKFRVYSMTPNWYRGEINNPYPIKCGVFTSVYNCKGEIRRDTEKNNVIQSIEKHYNNFFTALVAHLSESNNNW